MHNPNPSAMQTTILPCTSLAGFRSAIPTMLSTAKAIVIVGRATLTAKAISPAGLASLSVTVEPRSPLEDSHDLYEKP